MNDHIYNSICKYIKYKEKSNVLPLLHLEEYEDNYIKSKDINSKLN